MLGLSIILAVFCAALALVVLGVGGFVVLLKLGVIVRAAGRPAIQDHGNYSLDQGREVRSEEEPPERESSMR